MSENISTQTSTLPLASTCVAKTAHDCACLTCKNYCKGWPQAALSSAHVGLFLNVQVRPADQAGYPEILQRASLDRALQVSSVPLQFVGLGRGKGKGLPLVHRVLHTHPHARTQSYIHTHTRIMDFAIGSCPKFSLGGTCWFR